MGGSGIGPQPRRPCISRIDTLFHLVEGKWKYLKD